MKRFYLIVLLGVPLTVVGQNNLIFYGGAGDGWKNDIYHQSVVGIYKGNTGDGWNTKTYSQTVSNPFRGNGGDGWQSGGYIAATILHWGGGNGDSWSAKNYEPSVPNLFLGNAGDGWSSASHLPTVANIFLGNSADGWSSASHLPTVANIFLGNSADGWSSESHLPTVANIFLGNSGDGWASNYHAVGPLPVEMLQFEAQKRNSVALLAWKVGVEEQIAAYEVERSRQAVTFQQIGVVAQSAASKRQYQFTDSEPMNGHNYYRLKIRKKDGTYEYTPTRLVVFDQVGTDALLLFPNPAEHIVQVRLPESWEHSPLVVNIYDVASRLVMQNKVGYESTISFDITSLQPGNYMVQIANNNHTGVAKLIVIR